MVTPSALTCLSWNLRSFSLSSSLLVRSALSTMNRLFMIICSASNSFIVDSSPVKTKLAGASSSFGSEFNFLSFSISMLHGLLQICLLYTSDAADEEDSVDLGGRRIIKKKKKKKNKKNKNT